LGGGGTDARAVMTAYAWPHADSGGGRGWVPVRMCAKT
jgi:hypothetical protein